MRIAFIADVHGNYPALVNVVEDAVTNKVDKMVFVGDYIFDLPFSNEVARLLMKLENAHIIKGNKESYLEKLANDDQNCWTANQMGCIYQTYRELSKEAFDFLNGLDDECNIQINPNISIYAIHDLKLFKPSTKVNCGSTKYHKKMLTDPFTHEQFLSEFSELINLDESKALVNQIDSNIIVFGHNHLQAYAYCDGKLIINPGSCGQPLDFNPAAAYTILEVTTNGLTVHEKRASYDIDSTINYAKKSTLYEKGKIWSDLVFLALKTGRDYFGIYFEIASQIAKSKNETGSFFSNSTWDEALIVFNGMTK